jgi:hypothetical protein
MQPTKPSLKFVPAQPALDELEQLAAECERKAQHEPEPAATELREKAKLYRAWIAALSSGQWTS